MNEVAQESAYARFRGKCREMSEAAVKADPTLRLVRGHYYCPFWGIQAHWWAERPDGTIVDPAVEQFPSAATAHKGRYVEFDGTVTCEECGVDLPEKQAVIMGNHATCSDACAMRLVGL